MYKYIQIIGIISLFLSCDHSKKLTTSEGENISISEDLKSNQAIEAVIAPYKVNLDKSRRSKIKPSY